MTDSFVSSIERRVVPAAGFAGIGLLTAVYCLYALATPLSLPVTPSWELVLELSMLGLPAIGHAFTGYWLSTGPFSDRDAIQIGFAAAVAAVLAALTTVVLFAVAFQSPLSYESSFFLLVGTGTEGALVGALAAVLVRPSIPIGRTTTEQTAETATTESVATKTETTAGEARDQLEMLHSLVRHNVTNRVTVMQARIDVLRDESDGETPHLDALDSQQAAIVDLLRDVEDAVDAATATDATELIPVAQAVAHEVETLRKTHPDVSVETDVPDGLRVEADELFTAVLENLLANAVTHHDREEIALRVTAERERDTVSLRVADDGPGIPDEEKAAVMEPEVGDGTGMGMYLVETLVESYGGEVRLHDNDPRGTVVELRLQAAD